VILFPLEPQLLEILQRAVFDYLGLLFPFELDFVEILQLPVVL
jgi:hypothetical protein